MLARATARSVRVFASPTPVQAALPSFHSRSYAKQNKPKRPFEYKAPTSTSESRHGPGAQRPLDPRVVAAASQTGKTTQANSDGPGYADSSKLEEEFNSIINEKANTQPELTQPTAPSPFSNLSESNAHLDEFQPSAPSDGNTVSQSKLPSAIEPVEAQRQQAERPPTGPLPDLTQGIPSTLDSELASSTAKSDPGSLNITEDPSQDGGRDGGDLPKSAYISSFERRRNQWANWFYASTLGAAIFGSVYLGRNWKDEQEESRHPDAPSGWGFGLFYNRANARLADMLDYYNEPAFPKLLPDTAPEWERPYTLVMSLEDLLVHSEWSREHGWRMAKRPGVDYFLRYLSQYYELVIFTSVPSMIGHPIIQKLDPYRIVLWPLFREATRYKKGEYIKVRHLTMIVGASR